MPAILTHPHILQPEDPTIAVWRYMDFAKYVAMLQSKALYFSRLDQLGDPYEGTLSREEYEHYQTIAEEGELKGEIPADWRGRYFDMFVGVWRRARLCQYVNCWHMNNGESEAMWRLYGVSGFAIAIRTRYCDLVTAIPGDLQYGCHMGIVRYADHATDSNPIGSGFSHSMRKRASFVHEQECRAIVLNEGVPPEREIELLSRPLGLEIPVNLEALIDCVVTSPTAPKWFAETVQSVTNAYQIKLKVQPSALLSSPYI